MAWIIVMSAGGHKKSAGIGGDAYQTKFEVHAETAEGEDTADHPEND